MWEIDISADFTSFLLSIALGGFFSLLYDVFIAMHKTVFKSTFTVFITDIFYFLVISIITFMFCILRSFGYIRAYILFGIAIGFISLHFLISKYFSRVLEVVIKTILAVFSKLSLVLWRFVEWLMIKLKNLYFFFKKRLQILISLLYNHFKSKR